jgi:hypothetical protein
MDIRFKHVYNQKNELNFQGLVIETYSNYIMLTFDLLKIKIQFHITNHTHMDTAALVLSQIMETENQHVLPSFNFEI